jgi:hypothetical protein
MIWATIVQTKELLQTIAAAVIAGVGLSVVFSLAVYGATRFADLSREDRPIAATAAIVVSAVAFLACVAAVVIGIVVMTKK